jgi:predicted DNA-binding protein YlxM (UPF0122 family)
MDKTVYYSTLYDYYGGLLTDNQREIFEDYYFENLTLQEIADNNEVSKNAIHKTINTITKKLESYEEILKYHEKLEKIKTIIKDEKLLEEVMEIL